MIWGFCVISRQTILGVNVWEFRLWNSSVSSDKTGWLLWLPVSLQTRRNIPLFQNSWFSSWHPGWRYYLSKMEKKISVLFISIIFIHLLNQFTLITRWAKQTFTIPKRINLLGSLVVWQIFTFLTKYFEQSQQIHFPHLDHYDGSNSNYPSKKTKIFGVLFPLSSTLYDSSNPSPLRWNMLYLLLYLIR